MSATTTSELHPKHLPYMYDVDNALRHKGIFTGTIEKSTIADRLHVKETYNKFNWFVQWTRQKGGNWQLYVRKRLPDDPK